MLSLPNSLWAATARPPPRTPALVGRLRADVVVVGAGFTGLSAALHLAKAGARVVVLEAMEPGWGASGRNGGQVIPGLRAEQRVVRKRLGTDVADRLIEFAGTSARFLFDLVDEHGLRCEAENCGWIQAAQARGALGNLEARAEEGMGIQLWLNTPIRGLRIGAGALSWLLDGQLSVGSQRDRWNTYHLSFDASERGGEKIVIDEAVVNDRLGETGDDEDLVRYSM